MLLCDANLRSDSIHVLDILYISFRSFCVSKRYQAECNCQAFPVHFDSLHDKITMKSPVISSVCIVLPHVNHLNESLTKPETLFIYTLHQRDLSTFIFFFVFNSLEFSTVASKKIINPGAFTRKNHFIRSTSDLWKVNKFLIGPLPREILQRQFTFRNHLEEMLRCRSQIENTSTITLPPLSFVW